MTRETAPDGLPLFVLTPAELGSFAMILPLMTRIDELDAAVRKLEAICRVPYHVTATYSHEDAIAVLQQVDHPLRLRCEMRQRWCVVYTRAVARDLCDKWRSERIPAGERGGIRPQLVKMEPEGMVPVEDAKSFVEEVLHARKMVGNAYLLCQGKSVAVYEFSESEFGRAKYGPTPAGGVVIGDDVMAVQRPRTARPVAPKYAVRVLPDSAGPIRGLGLAGSVFDDMWHHLPFYGDASKTMHFSKGYSVPKTSSALDAQLPPGTHSWEVKVRTRQGEEIYYENARSGDAARVQIRKRIEGVLKVISCKQTSKDKKDKGFHK